MSAHLAVAHADLVGGYHLATTATIDCIVAPAHTATEQTRLSGIPLFPQQEALSAAYPSVNRSWWHRFTVPELPPIHRVDPLAEPKRFAAVPHGEAEPLVTFHAGVRNIQVAGTILESAASGYPSTCQPDQGRNQ